MPTTNHKTGSEQPDEPPRQQTLIDGRRNDRRQRLVAAATRLFRSQGPNGTGISAICEAGQASKGVFSHHFPGGKDELVLEVVRQNAAEIDDLLDQALGSAETVREAIRAIFDFYADLLDDDPDFGCPLAAAVVDASSTNELVRNLTSSSFQRWQTRLGDAILNGITGSANHGANHSEDDNEGGRDETAVSTKAQDAALTVVAAMEGAILLARAHRDPDILRRTGASVASLIQ